MQKCPLGHDVIIFCAINQGAPLGLFQLCLPRMFTTRTYKPYEFQHPHIPSAKARVTNQPALTLAHSDPTVRRQGFWNQWQLKLRESFAHLVDCIMRRAGGDASVALRVSFV